MIGKIKEMYIWISLIGIILLALIASYFMKANILILVLLGIVGAIFIIIIYKYDFILITTTMLFGLVKEFLTYNLRLPGNIAYILDLLIIILLIKVFINMIQFRKKINFEVNLCIIFSVLAVVSFLLNGVGIKGFINSFYFDYFRYFVIYVAIIRLDINRKEIDYIMKFIMIFMLLQVPVILYQMNNIEVYETSRYVIEDYYSGLLGGKATSELGFLILLVISYYYAKVMNKNIGFIKFLFIVSYFLIIVFVSEIKIIVVLIPVVIIIINTFYKKNIKGFIIIAMLLLLSFLSMNYIVKLYPKFGEVFTDKQILLENVDYIYAGSGISRMNGIPTAIKEVNSRFYWTLIGKGPGYGVISYNGNYQYRIFYFPYIIAEYGLGGFIILITFYLSHLIKSIKLCRIRDEFKSTIGIMGIGLVIIISISGIYSMSMVKTNFAIVAWAVLGIVIKSRKNLDIN